MYRIGINASFLRKPYTGIGQVTTNILREFERRTVFRVGGKDVDAKDVLFFVYLDEEGMSGIPKRFLSRTLLCSYRRDDLVRKFFFERFLIPRAARRDRLDAFLSLYQSATVFAKRSRIKHVMIVHDIIPELFPEYQDTWRKRLSWKSIKCGVKRASNIVAVSRYTRRDLIKHWNIPVKSISTATIDVDPVFSEPVSRERISMVRRHYGLSKEYFLSAGGLETRKNVESTIFGYERFIRRNSKNTPDLVIVGALLPHLAPLVLDVETLVRKRNLTGRVHMLDVVAQNDMPSLYAGSLALVFPSRYEGFGMPVLEAMRAGTPVITTKKTSLPEVAGDAARYCDESAEGIANAMEEIFRNSYLRAELRRRGSERAKLFSWRWFADSILAKM